MKKILLISVVVFGIGLTAHAQLGEPTTHVKDTFHISSVFYNGTALGKADWPDTIIVEDALSVYIAQFVYVKGKLKYTLGDENIYEAICNGKTIPMTIKRQEKYTIGDYEFIVEKEEHNSPANNNQNAFFSERRLSGGAGFSLVGRSARALPSPNTSTQKEGKVVVKIWVDRAGNVTQTSAPEKGSTLTDLVLVNQAETAALKAKFSAKDDAPEVQTGTVTYVFRSN